MKFLKSYPRAATAKSGGLCSYKGDNTRRAQQFICKGRKETSGVDLLSWDENKETAESKNRDSQNARDLYRI